jgi:mannosyl-3-phosphoglycerate phosphatase
VLPSSLILFTDLDGTLLDPANYSHAAAQEALDIIERRRVPLIFCTSKTRAEVEVLRRRLGNAHPFVTENGGGVFIPHGYFPMRMPGSITVSHYHCLALGRPYAELTAELDEIAAEAGAGVVGFHQMSARDIARNTGLPLREAELARAREFDEPFFFAGTSGAAEQKFAELVKLRRLELTRGDRFWHLFGGSDKGRAVRELARLYREASHSRRRSIALGNSANDLPMLRAADVAVLLPKGDGEFDGEVLARLPRIRRGSAPGPAGWNQAVLEILG